MRLFTIGIIVLALITAACAADDPSDPAGGDGTRVEIVANDALRFEPSTVEVGVGDTVTFEVTNTGQIDHEFTVGDDDTMGMMSGPMMSGSMDGGGMDHGGGASVDLPAGATAELTITFDEAGSIPFACHVDGHDVAGMTGVIEVT